jgi:hypothetical protein
LTALAAATAVLVADAVARAPDPGGTFFGTGRLYENTSAKWKREAGAPALTFQVNRSGTRLVKFSGEFNAWCGVSGATVSAGYLTVKGDGSFSYRFSRVRSQNGKAVGRTYVWIWGRFTGAHSASVSYLVNYGGLHDRDPYDARKPAKLGCASLVRGSAEAT